MTAEMARQDAGTGTRPTRPTADARGRYVVRPEWIRVDTLINVGLIVLGVYILQAFISSNVADVASRISVVAWALAIPLLAFLALLGPAQETFRYASFPLYLLVARGLAQGAAVIGFVAAVWHLWMPASLMLIASGLAGFVVYRLYSGRLDRDNSPDSTAG